MREFFYSIWLWLAENIDAILLWLSAFATSGAGVNLLVFLKTAKTTKENTNSTKELKESITEVQSLHGQITELTEKNEAMEAKLTEACNITDILLTKINAILEVQSLVYTTIKDEKTRVAVNNILTNAKYAITEQRAKLLEQLEALKEQVKLSNLENQEKVTQAVQKAVSIVEASDKETNIVTRG